MSASIKADVTESILQHDGTDAVPFDAGGLKKGAFNDGVVTGLDLASDVPFRKGFTSTEQAITSAGTLSLVHGLGVKPSLTQCSLICKVAEFGYSIGDDIDMPSGNAPTNRGIAVNRTVSAIEITFGNEAAALYYVNKTTGAATTLTNANWKLVVRAFA